MKWYCASRTFRVGRHEFMLGIEVPVWWTYRSIPVCRGVHGRYLHVGIFWGWMFTKVRTA